MSKQDKIAKSSQSKHDKSLESDSKKFYEEYSVLCKKYNIHVSRNYCEEEIICSLDGDIHEPKGDAFTKSHLSNLKKNMEKYGWS